MQRAQRGSHIGRAACETALEERIQGRRTESRHRANAVEGRRPLSSCGVEGRCTRCVLSSARALSRCLRGHWRIRLVRDIQHGQRLHATVRRRPFDRLSNAHADQCSTDRGENRNAVLIDIRIARIRQHDATNTCTWRPRGTSHASRFVRRSQHTSHPERRRHDSIHRLRIERCADRAHARRSAKSNNC